MRNCKDILKEILESIEGGGRVVTFMDDDIEEIKAALCKPTEPAPAQDERDSFKRYRLAGEFCVSRGIDDDSEIRPKILDAFCSGYACAAALSAQGK